MGQQVKDDRPESETDHVAVLGVRTGEEAEDVAAEGVEVAGEGPGARPGRGAGAQTPSGSTGSTGAKG